MSKSSVKPLSQLLNDPDAMAEEKQALIESLQGSTVLPLRQALQVEAFKVMLADARDRGIVTPGLLTRKKEQVQTIIADCTKFAIAVGNTFDMVDAELNS